MSGSSARQATGSQWTRTSATRSPTTCAQQPTTLAAIAPLRSTGNTTDQQGNNPRVIRGEQVSGTDRLPPPGGAGESTGAHPTPKTSGVFAKSPSEQGVPGYWTGVGVPAEKWISHGKVQTRRLSRCPDQLVYTFFREGNAKRVGSSGVCPFPSTPVPPGVCLSRSLMSWCWAPGSAVPNTKGFGAAQVSAWKRTRGAHLGLPARLTIAMSAESERTWL